MDTTLKAASFQIREAQKLIKKKPGGGGTCVGGNAGVSEELLEKLSALDAAYHEQGDDLKYMNQSTLNVRKNSLINFNGLLTILDRVSKKNLANFSRKLKLS